MPFMLSFFSVHVSFIAIFASVQALAIMTPPNVFDIACEHCYPDVYDVDGQHPKLIVSMMGWVSYNDRHPKEILVGILKHRCDSPVRPSLKVCWTRGTLRWLLCKMLRKKHHVFCEFH